MSFCRGYAGLSSVRSIKTATVIDSVLFLERSSKIRQNFDGAIQEHGEVAVIGQQLRVAVRHCAGEPSTVGRRHHQVLFSLPEEDWNVDLNQIETPGLREGQVVIAPTVNAVLQRKQKALMHFAGEVPGHDLQVRRAQNALQGVEGPLLPRSQDLFTPEREQLAQLTLTLKRGTELNFVAVSHSVEKVQPRRGPRTDTADDRDSDAPVAGESSTGQGMWSATGGTHNGELLNAKHVGHCQHVRNHVGDSPAG